MRNIDKVLDSFVNGNYFIVFLVITLVILLVLVIALIKTREDYNELVRLEEEKLKKQPNHITIIDPPKEEIEEVKEIEEVEDVKPIKLTQKVEEDDDDLMDDLKSLMASNDEDKIDVDKPLIKQIDLKNIKTFDNVVEDYEALEEENAVISREELEKKAKERMDALGTTENQEMIAKYEEEQEKKAIISYEQLLENASNITLTYKEEKSKSKGAPKVNKVEVEQREVTGSQMYLEEEEFLKILKEFRISLE